MSTYGKPWTEAEDRRLQAGMDLGMTFAQIANAYLPGRTAGAAIDRSRRLSEHTRPAVRPAMMQFRDIGDAIPPNDAAVYRAAERGSAMLLAAMVGYYERRAVDAR